MALTAVEAVEAWLKTFSSGDFDSWMELADEDLSMDIHFAPPGFPSSNKGRDACLQSSREFWKVMKSFDWAKLELHATDDPDLVMGDGKSRAVTATGRDYRNEYAFKVRVRNGRVLEYHEYINPLPVMAILADSLVYETEAN